MRLANWRDPNLEGFAGIWPQLIERWRNRLSWDTGANWLAIDAQRRNGDLPGLALVDQGVIAAWAFFVVQRDVLQIGGFEARDADTASELLDAILALANEFAPDGSLLFSFTDTPGLEPLLRDRGFDTERYLYLTRDIESRSLTAPTASPALSMPWVPDVARPCGDARVPQSGLSTSATACLDEDDVTTASSRLESPARFAARLPSLLSSAYDQPTLTRPFAWHGQRSEWDDYAVQLTATTACGHFEADLSAAAWWPDGDMRAAVVATTIGPGVVHLAQVAVAPGCRGNRLAWSMIDDVRARAWSRGYTRMSLLVGERNAGARKLYERFGFHGTESFLSAGRRSRR